MYLCLLGVLGLIGFSICIGISTPSKSPDILVGTLGVLVTALVGWNIFTLIDLKEVKNELQTAKDEIERKAAEAISVSLMQNAIAMNTIEESSMPTAFLAFNAIGVLIPKSNNDENLADRAQQEAIKMLHNIIDRGIEIECTPEEHRRYITIAAHINDSAIIDWVSGFHRIQ